MPALDDFIDRFTILIKFGRKDRLESLQKGFLYMKPLQYYIDLEEQQGLVGQGDRNEARLVMNQADLRLFDYENGTFIGSLSGKATIGLGYEKCPAFCLFSLDKRNIIENNISADGKLGTIKTRFKPEQANLMQKNFGDFALIITDTTQFQIQLRNAALENGSILHLGKVLYSDNSVVWLENLKELQTPFKIAYHKDKSFAYQQEYRALIENLTVEDSYTLDIGSINTISEIFETKKLLDMELVLRIPLE